MRKIVFFLVYAITLFGLDFTVTQKGKSLDDNNTVVIFGGMQGDEPGGFHAASLLISDYNITKGKIIVAPNLAFESIIKRGRGENGDLNRKFADINFNDPDYHTVERIKKLILQDEVGMVINLHDGSGFYRPAFINSELNPKRWGNSSIIDTREINASKYNQLEHIAQNTVDNINLALVDPKHQYHLKNTNTKEDDDTEMLKALTYFVISNKKAAFANEASKSLPVHLRAYYHLLAIEAYLKTAGIEFERSFELTPQGVYEVINKELEVKLFNDKILLTLKKPRDSLSYLPTPINQSLNYQTSNEITAVLSEGESFFIQYGNRFQTRLYPEYFEFSNALNKITMIIDGEKTKVPFASKIVVKNNFKIPRIKGVRANVIGLDIGADESEILINKNQMQEKYSIDEAGKIFRIELYELRNANLKQNKVKEEFTKIIKNPPKLSKNELEIIQKKDKFLGSILVEFE
ncbi:M99 family carboxypeptidase catalytic domain-containing protein [Campylobacter sp. CCS1377]|uniref:M99 family carboxypeptidase catalytic domain-containing protein n=1 Tax=Campylobacter sp. CCS1377 TaxID=3158229 RepID=A0AAU7E8H9_9BACT